ncbi:FKBP-type peptidyl-prolyl cis-trans isomerase [Leptospira sp. 201903075]|uniref:FKBP-type peptidyl-prolyl cis-trans isomerase n=1 Tax=Leptospira chreensis TaxID=2810035 RepID=UPI001966ACD4|nr:FKBP-type peptidyl-prolyl cis-trans isomerase [Leptospira chreensis]MBM9591080.1 FKBP-type peptidyl-prolyl cis-trans isomerase [Leptospira chreensis]
MKIRIQSVLFFLLVLVFPIQSAEKDFQIIDLVIGKGEEAFSGSYVTVHYVGKLTNGTKFDSSRDRNRPFEFNLGAGEVVKGWDKGVKGMRVGGKRKLIIPPELGYGSKKVGNIPADSTLIFEVELLKIY